MAEAFQLFKIQCYNGYQLSHQTWLPRTLRRSLKYPVPLFPHLENVRHRLNELIYMKHYRRVPVCCKYSLYVLALLCACQVPVLPRGTLMYG